MSDDGIQLVDEISTSTDTSNEMDEMDEWVVDIEGRLKNPGISHASRQSMVSDHEKETPSIFGKWDYWDDFGASFIPETQKWEYVACMTHWHGFNIKSFLKYIQGKVDLAWSYYRGVGEQFRTAENNKRFIEHLLASSCFLILTIVFSTHEKYQKFIKDKMDDQTTRYLFTIMHGDEMKYAVYILTMNYQIPWFVVEAVYTELSNIGKLLDTPILNLAISLFQKNPTARTSKLNGGTVPKGGFKHLLHIFHWSLVPDGKYLLHSTELIRRFHIPTATELHLSQMGFVNDEGGLIDVSYSNNKRLSRVMQITTWHISPPNTKFYESALKFEQQYGYCGTPFTAYVACMACLVKTEEDARVLRENGVIPSTTFDDKDVLRCVQELKSFIPFNFHMPNELIILEKKVMAHYQRSSYRVYGEFKSRYCSNPWITISVIAGILLFVLTFLQTLYGMLSYYNQ